MAFCGWMERKTPRQNARLWPQVVLMLARRLQRWPDMETGVLFARILQPSSGLLDKCHTIYDVNFLSL